MKIANAIFLLATLSSVAAYEVSCSMGGCVLYLSLSLLDGLGGWDDVAPLERAVAVLCCVLCCGELVLSATALDHVIMQEMQPRP